eukprot:1798560-Lingulodinium_polyedra.AAC.1
MHDCSRVCGGLVAMQDQPRAAGQWAVGGRSNGEKGNQSCCPPCTKALSNALMKAQDALRLATARFGA